MKRFLKIATRTLLVGAFLSMAACEDGQSIGDYTDPTSTDNNDSEFVGLRFWQAHSCPERYTFINLAQVPEPNDDRMLPSEIDNKGNVCGYTDYTGFYWTGDEYIDLMAEKNGDFTSARVNDCSNDTGVLVGHGMYPSSDGHYTLATAFYWTRSEGMVNINVAVDEPCTPWAVNDKREVLMECTSGTYVWSAQQGHVLVDEVKGADSNPTPWSINNDGIVVGSTWDGAKEIKPFIWTQEMGIKRLMDLGGKNAGATDINDHGQMIGQSDLTTGYNHPVVWEADGTIFDLGLMEQPSNLVKGKGLAINDYGVIVGHDFTIPSGDPMVPVQHGWIWCGGEKYALNSDIIEDFEDWHIYHPYGINDDGEIAAQAQDPEGNTRAIKLVPVETDTDTTLVE